MKSKRLKWDQQKVNILALAAKRKETSAGMGLELAELDNLIR